MLVLTNSSIASSGTRMLAPTRMWRIRLSEINPRIRRSGQPDRLASCLGLISSRPAEFISASKKFVIDCAKANQADSVGHKSANKGLLGRMSIEFSIAARLREVRSRLGYPQSKMAAALGIADRSYKHYEAGTRDLPLPIAVKFCDVFDIDLQWLVFGEHAFDPEKSSQIFEKCILAVLNESDRRKLSLPNEKVAKTTAYIASQCLAKCTDPEVETAAFMEIMV
jgi:DNA-binding XRE family transcriptional regulator